VLIQMCVVQKSGHVTGVMTVSLNVYTVHVDTA